MEKRQQEKGGERRAGFQHLHLLSHTDSTSVKSILPSRPPQPLPGRNPKSRRDLRKRWHPYRDLRKHACGIRLGQPHKARP